MRSLVTIQLTTNTHIGSGVQQNQVIDSDNVYDHWGLPVLPAKRVKGILREVAETFVFLGVLEENRFHSLFGEGGGHEGTLRIDTAYLREHASLRAQIEKMGLAKEEVIDLFTTERAMTAIDEETGVAKPHSLRFIRVLDAQKFREMDQCFVLPLTHEAEDQVLIEELFASVKEVGAHSTRGMGVVKCTVVEGEVDQQINLLGLDRTFEKIEKVSLDFLLEAKAPLVLSDRSGNGNDLEEAITGTQLLGALAARFAPSEKMTDSFYHTFLNDDLQMVFHDLQPLDDHHGILYPTPLCLKKKKYMDQGTKWVDLRVLDEMDKVPQLKSPKSWMGLNNEEATDLEISRRVTQHHRRPKNRSEASPKRDDGELYTVFSINAGQRYAGRIVGPYHRVQPLVESLRENPTLRFGMSKNTEYGLCHVISMELHEHKMPQRRVSGTFDLLLTSPMLHMNRWGTVVPDLDSLKDQVATLSADIQLADAWLGYQEIGGFHGKWRLPRPRVSAWSRGSVLRFKVTSGQSILLEEWIEKLQFTCCTRTLEGFNQMRLLPEDWSSMEEQVLIPQVDDQQAKASHASKGFLEILQRSQDERHQERRAKRDAMHCSIDTKHKKVTGALRSYMSLYMESGQDSQVLIDRIRSIKEEKKRKLVSALVPDTLLEENPAYVRTYLAEIITRLKNTKEEGDHA